MAVQLPDPAVSTPDFFVRIVKYGTVAWRQCRWLQPEDFAWQSPEQRARLKRSLVKNGFAAVFYVWESEGVIWILDGHQRESLLEELTADGVAVPEQLPALWIAARDLREAKKLLLVYRSHYSKIQKDPLLAFVEDLDMSELVGEIDLGDLDLADFHFENVEATALPELASEDRLPFQTITFTLHDEQAEWVHQALDRAQAAGAGESALNKNSNGNALAMICHDYLERNSQSDPA